jgi:hypothetical protein
MANAVCLKLAVRAHYIHAAITKWTGKAVVVRQERWQIAEKAKEKARESA